MQTLLVILLLIGILAYYFWITNTKDAPFVPMDTDVVERVMNIAQIGPKDVFYDLGSGDGRLVIAAALRGARADGIELDKYRAWYSRIWIKLLRLDDKAQIINKNIFDVSLNDATVVNAYLLPETHQRLKQKLLKELKKGTKVVAVAFKFEGWKVVDSDPRGTIYGQIYLFEI